ncbi:hypothetical protein KSF78_0005816 [Schistosoma japonicum]|nr:hypothetical protein KSF78_0005816 [Schistosoma japonicum]
MDNRNLVMQSRRSSIKLYTEFSQNYPSIHNVPIQIDDSSHMNRSITIPSVNSQSTILFKTLLMSHLEFNINNQPQTLIDASTESSTHLEQSTNSLNTLRVYLLNQLPISVLSDESSIKKLHNCSICMEYYHINDRIMGLPCFHMFHHNCLCAWIEKNLQCPICRMPIYDIDY